MLSFQPPGFGQKCVSTPLGKMVYYTQVSDPWPEEVTFPQRQSESASKPTVVFFHNFGGGASAYEWSKVYSAIASIHPVIAPDLLGWGDSEHPQRRYTPEDYISSIAAFLTQLNTQRNTGPIIAVASSFTAGLILRLAANSPDYFQRLFLACPAGFKDFGAGAGRRLPEPLINTPFLDQAIYALGATNELAVRSFLERFLFYKSDRLSNEIVAAYLASAQKPDAEYAALSFLRGDLYFDLAPYVPKLTVPTAMVWGGRSQFTSVALGRRLAALNPEAVQQFQVVSETGVLPHLEQPGVVTALLLQWLSLDL
ncbi:MAG: alpha/beta hydrolase [Cyanobacteria bacterium J06621_11]